MPLSPAERREVTALRLTAQRISAPDFERPEDAVRHLLAMQAQDYPGAKWAVGLRVPLATDATIEAAIADRRIARSWPMRGTLHFVPPEDLGWMLALSAPRLRNSAAKRRADLGITDEQSTAARRIAEQLMAGGSAVRRDALLAGFQSAGLATDGQRGYHLLWQLGHDGVIVFGPADGKQPTFALFDEWITHSRQLDADEALAEFALRYFTSHGPATVQDFAWWSNQTLGDARTRPRRHRIAARTPGLGRRHVLVPPGPRARTPRDAPAPRLRRVRARLLGSLRPARRSRPRHDRAGQQRHVPLDGRRGWADRRPVAAHGDVRSGWW